MYEAITVWAPKNWQDRNRIFIRKNFMKSGGNWPVSGYPAEP